MSEALTEVVDHLRRARSVLFVTGAGMSADSGLPTYRGVGGLYDRETTEEGYPIEQALSGEMLRTRPEISWKYIREIAAACQGAKPNRGHEVIAEIEHEAGLDRCVTLTQNIDGLHRAAGSRNVIEIHGSNDFLLCMKCNWRDEAPDLATIEIPPTCPSCTSVARPDVVLFGEMLPPLAVDRLRRELARGFDVTISIGTTSVFPYIVEPMYLARERGAYSVEINPGTTDVSEVANRKIAAGAAETLDAIWKAWREAGG